MENEVNKKIHKNSIYGEMMNEDTKVLPFVSIRETVSMLRLAKMQPGVARPLVVPKYKGLCLTEKGPILVDFTYELDNGQIGYIDSCQVGFVQEFNNKVLLNVDLFVDKFIQKEEFSRFNVYLLYTKDKDFICYAVQSIY